MKTKIRMKVEPYNVTYPNNDGWKVGDIGYIDGYVRGLNNHPCVVVIIGKKLHLCGFDDLEVVIE